MKCISQLVPVLLFQQPWDYHASSGARAKQGKFHSALPSHCKPPAIHALCPQMYQDFHHHIFRILMGADGGRGRQQIFASATLSAGTFLDPILRPAFSPSSYLKHNIQQIISFSTCSSQNVRTSERPFPVSWNTPVFWAVSKWAFKALFPIFPFSSQKLTKWSSLNSCS